MHFVSHGSVGTVKLGSVWLDLDNVDKYADTIAGWSEVLADDAELLLYGCNIAGGEEGRMLVETIGELTGAAF